jgi:hypothetical protein
MSAVKFIAIFFGALLLGLLIFGAILFVKEVVLPDLNQKAESMKAEIGESIRCQIKCSVSSALGIKCDC